MFRLLGWSVTTCFPFSCRYRSAFLSFANFFFSLAVILIFRRLGVEPLDDWTVSSNINDSSPFTVLISESFVCCISEMASSDFKCFCFSASSDLISSWVDSFAKVVPSSWRCVEDGGSGFGIVSSSEAPLGMGSSLMSEEGPGFWSCQGHLHFPEVIRECDGYIGDQIGCTWGFGMQDQDYGHLIDFLHFLVRPPSWVGNESWMQF